LLLLQKLKNKKTFSLGIIKIVVIIFVGVYLMGYFDPFYYGSDANLYAVGSVNIVNGSFEYTNEFLQNPEYTGFSFGPFIKTIHGTLIPHGNIGIYGLGAFSYFLGGYYALFYLGPIITILFFIISERVITKLFGSFAGLAALIFLSTDVIVLQYGRALLTDTIFSLLLILGCFFLINFLKEKTSTSILLCSGFLTTATFFRLNGIIFLPIEILIVFGYFFFHYIKIRKQDIELINSNKSYIYFLKPLSKKEIKKILKFTLYLLGPWSIFVIFLFSFNSYFYGEPFTTYLEQKRDVETEDIISSYLMFDSERFESIKSYSAQFLPDRTYFWAEPLDDTQLEFLLTRTASFNSVLLDQFYLSIISFSFLFSALFISLYFKINRKEIIVFIIFILSLLFFYSSSQIVSLTGITLRYMIPTLPFSFGILGYLMYRAWKINYQKISFKYYHIISKSWKGFLIIIFAIFLLSSLYYSNPVDSLIIKQNFKFKNPQVFADRYPLDQEGLPEKSILLNGRGRMLIWEYHAIPFNPFSGYNEKTQLWKNNETNTQPIKMMNELLDKGYSLYVFKEKNRGDPLYYRYLEAEHGLILKEHSETFCTLIRSENTSAANNIQKKSDDICHTFLNT